MSVHFALVFLLISTTVIASPVNTIITGEVRNAANKYIRIYEYSNFITYKPKKITQVQIDKNEKFRVELYVEKGEIKTVFFAVERFKSFDFFIEAEKNYELIFDSVDYSTQDKYYSPLNTAFPRLIFHIKNSTPDDINNLTAKLLSELATYTVNDFPDVIRTRDRKRLEGFRLTLDSIFENNSNTFFAIMIDYSYAELKFLARLAGNDYFGSTYFNFSPFYYTNPAFMNFFNVFFDKYIYKISRKIQISDIELHIVKDRNYKALLDSLGKDSLLANEVIRDMVLIKNLTQMYYSKLFPLPDLYNLLFDISQQSKFLKHRKIASDILNDMHLHISKHKAPLLIAREPDMYIFNLDSMKGLFTYIFFFNTHCLPCYPEMKILNNIYNKYNKDIYFVSVSLDVDFSGYYNFVKEHKYPWDIVNFAKNFDMEEQWGVKTYPSAFMISPDGYIIDDYAPLPSENLDEYIHKLLNTYNPDMSEPRRK